MLECIGDFVLIEEIPQDTALGFRMGTVLSVREDWHEMVAGDVVFYTEYTAVIVFEGKIIYVLDSEQVYARVKPA